MDFSYSDEQQAVADLARQILEDGATHERMKALEKGPEPRFDRKLWNTLAEAGLVGIAIPEKLGGAGMGFVEAAAIVQQVGRTVAPVPFLETVVLGALAIDHFGNPAQREAILPAVARGELILTAALQEDGDDFSKQLPPGTTATRDGEGWRLDGEKNCVPAGAVADRLLVPATNEDGTVTIYLVDARAEGVEVEALDSTSDQPEAFVTLDGVRVGSEAVLGEPSQGAEIVDWISLRGSAALSALAVGVCEVALEMTAEYTKTRKQFDQPIAMFQAVGHREADAYIDTEAVRLTSLQACWRIGTGMEADAAVSVAKFWAAEGGQRVVHAAQHLHGGIGVDRDYPLHRYFLHAKQLELTLGGATPHLLRVGQHLADAPI